MTGETLDVLLIEDNPGDARLIEEMLGEQAEFLRRAEVGGSATSGSELHHVEDLAAGLDRLAETPVDAVLLDLNLPDSTGLDTLAAVTDATKWTPVVVLTGLRDEEIGLEAIKQGAQDFLVKGEVTGSLLVRSLRHAIERARQEREREQRREQLAALNRLNEVSQEITHDVITISSREELEQAVTDRLVESDAYRFAWIGGIDRGDDSLIPRVAAGVEEGYLDETTVSIDEDEATGQGPSGRAARTHEVQVVQHVRTDPGFEPWREQARERGFRSSAAAPIVHEGFLYGILNVYATAPAAFSEPEVRILSRLGEVIGHAISAIDRRDALVADRVLELEFRTAAAAEELLTLSAEHGEPIVVDTLIRNEDAIIGYGRTGGISREEFLAAAERTRLIDDARVLTPEGDDYRFEIASGAAGPLVRAVGTHGGSVRGAHIADGELRFVVAFPPGRDKRQLVDLVEEHCPGATNYAQRTVERPDRRLTATGSVLEHLTEKQRTALETAYFAGYFDWPRESTGQEVADRLDISPATFTQHLRTAEKTILDTLYESEREELDRDRKRALDST